MGEEEGGNGLDRRIRYGEMGHERVGMWEDGDLKSQGTIRRET